MAEKHSTLPPLPKQEGVEFRHVPGHEGYAAGDNGTVWSCCALGCGEGFVAWRYLVGHQDPNGYYRVGIRNPPDRSRYPNRAKLRAVHQLVLEAFISRCPPGQQCRHLDGNPSNNRLYNLRWGTPRENFQDMVAHGRYNPPRGADHVHCKLSDCDVRDIRQLEGHLTHKAIADLYDVSRGLVSMTLRGEAHRHVD